MPAGMKSWPSVYILNSGVLWASSPKSYTNWPLVSVGQAVGSTPIRRTFVLPARFSRMKGKAMPPKLEPPPTQPMTTSG